MARPEGRLGALSLRRVAGRLDLGAIVFVALLIAVWQVAVSANIVTSDFLPAPDAIASAIANLTRSGEMTSNLGHTVYVTLLGWVLSAIVGVALGLALGLATRAWRYSMASVEFMRALPGISFVPVAVLLLGFSVRMELVVVIYVSVWPVLVNTIHGVRVVTPLHTDVARMMRMSTWTRIRRVVLPTTVPYVVVGLQISLTLALALAIVAEMVGNPAGVGHALSTAQNTLQPADMFAYVVVIGVVGVLLNAAFMRAVAVGLPGTASVERRER